MSETFLFFFGIGSLGLISAIFFAAGFYMERDVKGVRLCLLWGVALFLCWPLTVGGAAGYGLYKLIRYAVTGRK